MTSVLAAAVSLIYIFVIFTSIASAQNLNGTNDGWKSSQEPYNAISLINIAVSAVVSLIIAAIGLWTQSKQLAEQKRQFDEQLNLQRIQLEATSEQKGKELLQQQSQFREQMEFQWSQFNQQQKTDVEKASSDVPMFKES